MRLVSLILCVMVFDEPSWVLQSTGSPIISDKKTHSSSSAQNSNKSQQEQSGYRPSKIPESKTFKIPSTSNFAEIRNSMAFADKTYFLHEWLLHSPKKWFITAPPGSGKSAILDMALHFCNITSEVVDGKLKVHDRNKTSSYELFRGTKIFEVKRFFDEHFQKYSVIYIDFNRLINITDYESFKIYFCSVVKEMVNKYQYLASFESLNTSDKEFFENYLKPGNKFCLDNYGVALRDAGSTLYKVLKNVFRKDVIVLADSFDSVFLAYMTREVKIQEVRKTLYDLRIFFECLFDKKYLEKFLTTGIFAMKKKVNCSLEPELVSDIASVHFSDDEYIAKLFTLTKPEMNAVLTAYSLQEHSRFVEDWLGGSLVDGSHLKIFNIRLTLMFVQQPELRPRASMLSPVSDILQRFEKLFLLPDIVSRILKCGFGIPVPFRHDWSKETTFTLDELSALILIETNSNTENGFFKILERLGLAYLDGQARVADAANRASAAVMRDYLYSSNFIIRHLHIRADNEMTLINAISNLSPTSDSVLKLGRILQQIMVKNRNLNRYDVLRGLIYVHSRNVIDHYRKDIILEANVAVRVLDDKKAKLKDKPIDGNVDILLVWPQKKMGAIINVVKHTNNNSCQEIELKRMTDCRYFDIFQTDLRLSAYNITDKVIIGMSMGDSGLLKIAGEIRDSQNAVKSVFPFAGNATRN